MFDVTCICICINIYAHIINIFYIECIHREKERERMCMSDKIYVWPDMARFTYR
jgi:hypothetical protein